MKHAVVIRDLEAGDRERWRDLWSKYLSFYETVLPGETTDHTWERLLNPGQPMFALVAVVEGNVVGIAHCIPHQSCWTISDNCYLQDLFVDNDCRGLGIGRQLIEKVCQAARERGCSEVHWLTKENNHEARRLYDKIATASGFIEYNRSLL